MYSEYLRLPTERRKYNSGFIVNSFVRNHIDDTTGEVVWDANEQISKIKKVLNYKDCFITKKLKNLQENFIIKLWLDLIWRLPRFELHWIQRSTAVIQM